jgi:glycosyltransferase involved in cell wall biosynthesis
MVIAHLLSSFAVGGQERMAVELALRQRAAGHTVLAVSLASKAEGPLAAQFRVNGARVYTLEKRGGFDWTLPPRLAALLRRERARIVHTHNPQPLMYGALAGRLVRACVVHTKHGRNPGSLRHRWLRRTSASLVDAYVAVSKATAEVARAQHECGRNKLRVIANGIDVDAFSPDAQARAELRRELGMPADAWLFGTVGRLASEKNHDLLLDAAAPLLGPNCRLVIVGDGPEASRLRERVAAMQVRPWVLLTGARSDVPRLLASFDCFVLSSTTEGLPLVIPEAMATALPVISTDVGGIADVIDEGRTGWLVASNDVHSLRARLAEARDHPDLAQSMGVSARQIARERYSAERMARDYIALYETVLEKRTARRRVPKRPPTGLLFPEQTKQGGDEIAA